MNNITAPFNQWCDDVPDYMEPPLPCSMLIICIAIGTVLNFILNWIKVPKQYKVYGESSQDYGKKWRINKDIESNNIMADNIYFGSIPLIGDTIYYNKNDILRATYGVNKWLIRLCIIMHITQFGYIIKQVVNKNYTNPIDAVESVYMIWLDTGIIKTLSLAYVNMYGFFHAYNKLDFPTHLGTIFITIISMPYLIPFICGCVMYPWIIFGVYVMYRIKEYIANKLIFDDKNPADIWTEEPHEPLAIDNIAEYHYATYMDYYIDKIDRKTSIKYILMSIIDKVISVTITCILVSSLTRVAIIFKHEYKDIGLIFNEEYLTPLKIEINMHSYYCYFDTLVNGVYQTFFRFSTNMF